MLPKTTQACSRRAVAASNVWLAGQMLQPTVSHAQAQDVAGDPVNPTLQGIPPQDLIAERPAAILPDDQAQAAADAASARSAPRAAAESTATLHPLASIAAGLLMVALVTAGIALTVTALRKDLQQRRRRYRRRTRRSGPAPSSAKQPDPH